MNRDWLIPATILTGFCALAVSSLAQTYTVSAKPGALNFIEGEVSLNGDPVWRANLKSTFLKANDVLSVKRGKAEVLLTPGAFLRIGDNSQVKMIKPSLTETQLETLSGETMVEVDGLVAGSSIAVLDHGASTTLLKPGLYKFTEHSIAALEGKAEVAFGAKKVELKKDKEVEIGDDLQTSRLDLKQGDDLYAWSNTRAQYNAAATYAGSTAAYNQGGYGFSSFNGPGWYWNSPFNSYMWMPANGAFYSPFGWGFYGPGVVSYAPVFMMSGFSGYGYPYAYGYAGRGVPVSSVATTTSASPLPARLPVPVNPGHVGAASVQGNSPAAFLAARSQMQQGANFYGLRTFNGSPAAQLRDGQTFANMRAAVHAASVSTHAAASSGGAGNSGGSWSGGSSVGLAARGSGVSGASAHSSGGGHSK